MPSNSLIIPEVCEPPERARHCRSPRPSGCQCIVGLTQYCAIKWDHCWGMWGFGHYHNKTTGREEAPQHKLQPKHMWSGARVQSWKHVSTMTELMFFLNDLISRLEERDYFISTTHRIAAGFVASGTLWTKRGPWAIMWNKREIRGTPPCVKKLLFFRESFEGCRIFKPTTTPAQNESLFKWVLECLLLGNSHFS